MKFAPRAFQTDPVRVRSRRHGPGSNRRAGCGGFTLVEVLAALLLMAIIIPVTMEGMSVASRAGVLGQRKTAAMRVAERLLNELIIEGQTDQATTSGSIVDGDMTYPWSLRTETWPEDAMLHMTVTVTFTVQGNNYDVSASTLLMTAATTAEAAAAAAAAELTP
jgi:prepilin-type N-terminal cleavage/methylation domain-containing protein